MQTYEKKCFGTNNILSTKKRVMNRPVFFCDMLPHPPYPTKPCSPKRAARLQSIVSSLRDVCRRFRSTLARFAEWCPRKRGEKRGDGRRVRTCRCRSLFPRRPSPPVPSGGPHHSAANEVSKRNPLPIPTGPTIPQNFAEPPNHTLSSTPAKKNGPGNFREPCCTTCDLRLTIYDARLRKSQIVHRKSSNVLSLSSSRRALSPRPSRSSRARSRCPWRNRSGRG